MHIRFILQVHTKKLQFAGMFGKILLPFFQSNQMLDVFKCNLCLQNYIRIHDTLFAPNSSCSGNINHFQTLIGQ